MERSLRTAGLRGLGRIALALAGAGVAPSVAAANWGAADARALDTQVERYAPRMAEVAHSIWSHPELGYRETRTSALLQGELRDAGFRVRSGVAGMPTAFIARYTQGHGGPVIALLAEMDALPGMSQAAVPERRPVPGQDAGHACGHHLFGSGVVAAARAVRAWMRERGVDGELRVYGTPAEEGGSGKVFLVRAGLFDDVDAVLHWHPGDRNAAAQSRTLANISGVFRFHGIAAHAAMAPEQGRSALDAVEALDFMANAMREHVPQDTRIHYVITDGGKAPNVVPDFAEVYYYVRHPDPATVRAVMARLHKAAEGAALGTGTRVEFVQRGGVYSVLPNDTLGRVLDAGLRRVGGVRYDEAELRFARTIDTTLAHPRAPDEAATVADYAVDGQSYASTDVGDVSWTVPTAGLTAATWVPGTPAHSWQATAAGGTGIGIRGTLVAARVLAAGAARLMADPQLLRRARSEFRRRRGPGFAYRPLLQRKDPLLHYQDRDAGRD